MDELPELPDVLLLSEEQVVGESSDTIAKTSTATTTTMTNLPIIIRTIKDGKLLDTTKNGKIVGIVVDITNGQQQQEAMAAIGSVDWILVLPPPVVTPPEKGITRNDCWNMIPAENLIAAAQSTGTKLAFGVNDASQVGGLARALELGVDALCVNHHATAVATTDANNEVWNAVFAARRERQQAAARSNESSSSTSSSSNPVVITSGHCWRRATATATTIVLADRICVDLVQTLRPEEGCWVGSSAKVLALVLSEAAASQFVPTRPFRVNVGPVHSYILMADGTTTKYLSELQPADQVQVYNSQTNTSRAVAVGRIKQEVRPCVLIQLLQQRETGDRQEASTSSTVGQVFLQQAETVRLGQQGGSFVRVTDLPAQSKGEDTESVLLRIQSAGTHIGKAYTGKVDER